MQQHLSAEEAAQEDFKKKKKKEIYLCEAPLVSRIGLYFSILLLTPLNFICQHLTLKLCQFSHFPHYPLLRGELWGHPLELELFGSRGVPGSPCPLQCCLCLGGESCRTKHRSWNEDRLVERCWAVPWTCGAWLNPWKHLEPSVFEAEERGISLAERAGGCCLSQHYLLGVPLVAQGP